MSHVRMHPVPSNSNKVTGSLAGGEAWQLVMTLQQYPTAGE